MYKGMYVAVSGALAAQRRLDTLTNNLANVNTAGFKEDKLVFESYLAENRKTAPESPSSRGNDNPASVEYVVAAGQYSDFSQGPVRQTGNPLDIALNGDGFLAVMTYEGERYTRKGDLKVGSNGELVTADGNIVLNDQDRPIYVNDGAVNIDEDGSVWVDGDSISGQGEKGALMDAVTPRNVGRLKLVDFGKPYSLVKEGGGLYKGDPSSATPATVLKVEQGRLEGSNVNMISQMTQIIQNQRAAETYQKVIQESDNMTTQLILQVGRAV